MDKTEFKCLFSEITPDITSTKQYFWGGSARDKNCYNWFDLVIPDRHLITMTNSWLVEGIRVYTNEIKSLSRSADGWYGEVDDYNDFEGMYLHETNDYYWFFAINADSSECLIGKRKKPIYGWTEDELFEGFLNYCKNYGT